MTPQRKSEPVVREITIRCDDGPLTIRAGIFGPLAVHPTAGADTGDLSRYTVTQIRAGLSVIQNIPRDQAIGIAKFLQSDGGWDFAEMTDEMKPRLRKSLDLALEKMEIPLDTTGGTTR